jgi:membrane protease YdiL (CAAX protease family)
MFLSKIWQFLTLKGREYDLPARLSFRPSGFLVFIYLLPPYFIGDTPIKAIIGMSVVLFFIARAVFYRSENELGLSLRLNRSAKRTLLVVLILTLIIAPLALTGLYCLVEVVKAVYLFYPESYSEVEQLSYDFLGLTGSFSPDESIYEALAARDLKGVFYASVKTILGIMVFVPIFETIILFGFIVPIVWKNRSAGKTLWIVPLIFSILHPHAFLRPVALMNVFISGYIMTYLYMRTRSMYPSIILHFCNNTFTYLWITILNWGLPPPLK